MNRRSFLGFGLTALAAAAMDPERVLWEPGKRTYFLPPERPRTRDLYADFQHLRRGG